MDPTPRSEPCQNCGHSWYDHTSHNAGPCSNVEGYGEHAEYCECPYYNFGYDDGTVPVPDPELERLLAEEEEIERRERSRRDNEAVARYFDLDAETERGRAERERDSEDRARRQRERDADDRALMRAEQDRYASETTDAIRRLGTYNANGTYNAEGSEIRVTWEDPGPLEVGYGVTQLLDNLGAAYRDAVTPAVVDTEARVRFPCGDHECRECYHSPSVVPSPGRIVHGCGDPRCGECNTTAIYQADEEYWESDSEGPF